MKDRFEKYGIFRTEPSPEEIDRALMDKVVAMFQDAEDEFFNEITGLFRRAIDGNEQAFRKIPNDGEPLSGLRDELLVHLKKKYPAKNFEG